MVKGAPGLLRRKRQIGGGGTDLELNGASVSYGHGEIDRAQFDRLGEIMGLLRLVARAWGGLDGTVGGLWSAILASLSRSGASPGAGPPGADAARYWLARRLSRLNGSRALVIELAEGRIPPIVLRTLEGHLTGRDRALLARLRDGLDRM